MADFSITDVKPYVAAAAHKNVSASAGSTEDNTIERWILRAIRHMQRHDFECWREMFSLTLTAGTYQYPYESSVWPAAALTRPLRFDGNSVRPAGTRDPLRWVPTIQRMDERLAGGQWKEAGQGNGTPEYVTTMSGGLIVGKKVSQDFIDSHPTLEGYYYRGEDLSTSGFEDANLAMYSDFFDHLVNLSVVFGLQETDDTEFRTMLQYWETNDLIEMRGYDHVPVDDEPVPSPGWGLYVDGADHTF